ncbi:hypothetical protein N7520_004281 [Penicillium odoratum]|uniref:uncharacterized protein n=1 Tax=Penicillium odoratum TaxID=1167516 RepID=UPI002546DF25|nr:uncharacterized protein N7520_004281 [Penicillium odoratum]KAJ5764722.1 hypothetical protein N7520_004281 [Penicillium odoratum]
MASSPSAVRLPYDHYAIIYIDNKGKVEVHESSSIKEQNSTLFTPEVRKNFVEILGERVNIKPSRRNPRRRNSRRGRRRQDASKRSPTSNDMVSIEVKDTQKVLSYYEAALRFLQQYNCNEIAKSFIKLIEPNKPRHHPYNGGKPPPGSAPGAKGDPEKNKPAWWPSDVMHKHPDYLGKEDRIKLLLHIICKLVPYQITADKLRKAVDDTKHNLKDPSRVKSIYDVLRLRKTEEQFEAGKVDGSKVVVVPYREIIPKSEGGEDKDSIKLESSVEQPTPSDTRIKGVTSSRNVSKDGLNIHSDPQYQTYYTDPLQCTVLSSQSLLSTPVTANMINPYRVSVFDHGQNLPISSSDHKRSINGDYGPWETANLSQDAVDLDDYGLPSRIQVAPSQAYHVLTTPTIRLYNMSHAQSPMNPMI